MSSKYAVAGPVKAPLGSYPKLWRLLDHHFLKEDVPDRAALIALDTIVELNDKVLQNPKSANARTVRSSERGVRELVEIGAMDILTEVGWTFKVSRMEECWVLPYEADLENLKAQQEKILETQQKLRSRHKKAQETTKFAAETVKAEKLAIIRQIEDDKAERERRNALKAGAPPRPTQSLDEVRKQAVKERMERERLKKAKVAEQAAPSERSGSTSFPGSFPSASHRQAEDESDSDMEIEQDGRAKQNNSTTTHPRPATHRSNKGRSTINPIAVKPVVVKERYVASSQKLGGAEGADTGAAELPLELGRDDLLPSDDDDEDED